MRARHSQSVIVNAVLVAGIVAVLAYFIHLPHRIERRFVREHAVSVPGDEDELSRAA